MFKPLFLILLLPAVAVAQDYRNLSEQDMQKMMQGMQQMQSCMQGVDQAALERFGKRGEQVEREIRGHCARGERAAAQDKALAFGREVQQNAAMQKMMECGKMMAGMMPKTPFLDEIQQQSAGGGHICD